MELLEIIKKAAVDAVDANQPCDIVFGRVVNTAPLQINVNQKLILTSDFLVLTKAVQDYEVDIEVSHTVEKDTFNEKHTHTFKDTETETDTNGDSVTITVSGNTGTGNLNGIHDHKYKGRKKIRIYNGLHPGEEVILIKCQKGQKYIVLDRISNHSTSGEWS